METENNKSEDSFIILNDSSINFEKSNKISEKYVIEEFISKGSFGDVYKIRDKNNNIYYALKYINYQID